MHGVAWDRSGRRGPLGRVLEVLVPSDQECVQVGPRRPVLQSRLGHE